MTYTAPPTQPVTNLPVWDTVAAAYRSVLQDNVQHLPRAAVGPLVLSLLIGLIEPALSPATGGASGTEAAGPNVLLSIVLSILGTVPYVLFGVAWHRLVLLGPQVAAPNTVPRWERRHWAFFGYSLLVSAVFLGMILVAWLIGGLFGGGPLDLSGNVPAEPAPGPALMALTLLLVVGFTALTVMMRLSFVFPAVAVDERYSLGDAWRQTKGQGLRLLGAMILASLPFFLGIQILGGILGDAVQSTQGANSAGGGLDFALLLLVSIVVGYVWTAIGVSLLSIAFRTCSGWIPDTSGPGGGPPANLGTEFTEE